MMQQQAHRSIESMCRIAGVSRSGFYRHLQEHEPRVEETAVRDQVQQLALAHRGNYGYRRVSWELRQQGWAVNHKRVARSCAKTTGCVYAGAVSCLPAIRSTTWKCM